MGEVKKYWAHVWNQSGRKYVAIFWNAVVLGEHLVYKSKDDAINQGKKTQEIRNAAEIRIACCLPENGICLIMASQIFEIVPTSK